MTKQALVIFGTRPELIKMAPIIRAFKDSKSFKAISCATAQHRELLDQGLKFFEITADHDLNLMKENQTLFDITANGVIAMKALLETTKPDVVLVQGDTTTAFVAGLAAFYFKIPVAHVEAGLRTEDKYSPFPEEMNRRLLSAVADFHFAPTPKSAENLIRENINRDSIHCVGNTGIDSLLWVSQHKAKTLLLAPNRKMILMTAHRRENFGEPLQQILGAVKNFAVANADYEIIYPVHPNPNVKTVVFQSLGNLPNVKLIAPLDYGDLVSHMKSCQFVLTDSGGIQEEAPSFGKPILVLRENTERPEGVEAGCAKLVGHDPVKILQSMNELKDSQSKLYQSMSQAKNPYGDGTAAIQIVKILEASF